MMTTVSLSHVRADRLPENMRYADDGCEVARSCFTCPLPMCKYDDPGWLQREHRRTRDTAVLRARRTDRLSVAEVARRFGISTRTVHRILKQHREVPAGRSKPARSPLLSVLALRRRPLFRAPAPLPRIWPPAESDAPAPIHRSDARERVHA